MTQRTLRPCKSNMLQQSLHRIEFGNKISKATEAINESSDLDVIDLQLPFRIQIRKWVVIAIASRLKIGFVDARQ